MNIHWLQHVHFEGLGSIHSWAEKKGHNLMATRLWREDSFPAPENVKFLIVMGGPMGVYDDKTFPWLTEEKRFLASLVDSGCALLGICLGAQLLASVLGARVHRSREKEIGWFPVTSTATQDSPFCSVFPGEAEVFHWHGDTFDIPPGGTRLCSSKACRNQAFVVGDRILGLQFHLEMTQPGLSAIIDNCRDELVDAPWIQGEEEMVGQGQHLVKNNLLMEQILDTFEDLVVRR